MPLSGTSSEVLSAMKKQYGDEKGEQVFYAKANKLGGKAEKASTWKEKQKKTNESFCDLTRDAKNADEQVDTFITGTTPFLKIDESLVPPQFRSKLDNDEAKREREKKKKKAVKEMIDSAFKAPVETGTPSSTPES